MWSVGQRTWNFQQTPVLVLAFKKMYFDFSAIFVCYQDDLSNSERNEIVSLTARNFNNSWLICQIFRNNKLFPKYLTDRKLKMWAVFIFEIKGAKKDKISNFLKGSFSVMRDPIDMIFGVFSETCVRLLTSITLQFFFKI